jgi:hypothetical protein
MSIGTRYSSWLNRGRQEQPCPESVQPKSHWCAEALIDHPIAAMMKFQKKKGFGAGRPF